MGGVGGDDGDKEGARGMGAGGHMMGLGTEVEGSRGSRDARGDKVGEGGGAKDHQGVGRVTMTATKGPPEAN